MYDVYVNMCIHIYIYICMYVCVCVCVYVWGGGVLRQRVVSDAWVPLHGIYVLQHPVADLLYEARTRYPEPPIGV